MHMTRTVKRPLKSAPPIYLPPSSLPLSSSSSSTSSSSSSSAPAVVVTSSTATLGSQMIKFHRLDDVSGASHPAEMMQLPAPLPAPALSAMPLLIPADGYVSAAQIGSTGTPTQRLFASNYCVTVASSQSSAVTASAAVMTASNPAVGDAMLFGLDEFAHHNPPPQQAGTPTAAGGGGDGEEGVTQSSMQATASSTPRGKAVLAASSSSSSPAASGTQQSGAPHTAILPGLSGCGVASPCLSNFDNTLTNLNLADMSQQSGITDFMQNFDRDEIESQDAFHQFDFEDSKSSVDKYLVTPTKSLKGCNESIDNNDSLL